MEGSICINFRILRNLLSCLFSVFDTATNKNTAERCQFHLKPAYGLTMHKAQGMTLDLPGKASHMKMNFYDNILNFENLDCTCSFE